MRSAFLFSLCIVLFSSGCARSIQSAIDSAAQSTGQRVGTAVGTAFGDAIVRNYTSSVKTWYTAYLMEMAFHTGGHHTVVADARPYAEGDYTRWKVLRDSGSDDSWMERLYLGENDEGNAWWQVRFYDGDSMDTIIIQGLYAPDGEELVRLRAQFPGDSRPSELSVDGRKYAARPEPLTADAIAGATRDQRQETVAAGTFQIREVVFEDEEQNTQVWWLTDAVPGEVVRYGLEGRPESKPKGAGDDFDAANYILELQKFGSGERSALGNW